MVSLEDLFSKPRRAARSYGELLPWFAMVAPGLVLCQDGSLLAGFRFVGSDVEGKEDFQADQKINLLQTALRTLGDRITLWTIQDRRFKTDYNRGDFANPLAKEIDRQWEKACTAQKNAVLTQCMFIGFNFPNRSEAFFEALRAEIEENDGRIWAALSGLVVRRLTDRGAIARVRGQLADMVIEFEKIIASFAGIVEINLGFERLLEEHFLGELYKRANLASQPGPVYPSERRSYLNTYLGTDLLVRRNDQFQFQGTDQDTFVAALSTTGTPREADSAQMDSLMGLNCEYVLSQCYRFLDPVVAEKAIQDAEMFYRGEVKSITTRVAERVFNQVSEKVNTGNLYLADDAQAALVELTSGDNVSYGYYNMTLLALGDTAKAAEAAAGLLSSSLRANGFTMLRERQGLLPAILATMPGNANSVLRWKLASTANQADLAPIRTISKGEAFHPFFSKLYGRRVPSLCRFMTPYGIPYDFNPHVVDLGHAAVIGGAGSGKTSLLTLLISQFQKYSPAQTFVFDKDYSLMMAVVMLGGEHIDLGSQQISKPKMNPVRVMLRAGHDENLRAWIEILIGAGGGSVSTAEGEVIHAAIQGLRRSPESSWRLSALYSLISGTDQQLAAKLAPYVDRSEEEAYGAGAYSGYFDNEDDAFSISSLVGMECGGILESPQLASPFMDYAFYCILQKLDGETPAFIYVEEAWYMLKNPRFAAQMEDWLRTFRKKKAFLIFATQSLDEIANLPNLGSFMANIPTQIFLPPIASSVYQQAHLYKAIFGTNDEQLRILAQAIPKRDYLLITPSVTRLVNTQMPPLLIAINEATTQPRLRAEVLEAKARGGANWEIQFAKEKLHVDI